jgi:hypothetical protein
MMPLPLGVSVYILMVTGEILGVSLEKQDKNLEGTIEFR